MLVVSWVAGKPTGNPVTNKSQVNPGADNQETIFTVSFGENHVSILGDKQKENQDVYHVKSQQMVPGIPIDDSLEAVKEALFLL